MAATYPVDTENLRLDAQDLAALATALGIGEGGGGGGSAKPLPFFGNILNTGWARPAGAAFSTWLNQASNGGSAATLTDNAGGLPLVLRGITDGQAGASAYLTAVLKSRGAAPWTITVGMAAFTNYSAPYVCPIILYNAVSKNAVAFVWVGNTLTPQNNIWHYTDTDDPTIATLTTAESGTNKSTPFSDYFQWFRVVNDGTNITFYISPDGFVFEQLYTETLASFITSIDHVGFGYERTDGSGVNAVNAILWQWVES